MTTATTGTGTLTLGVAVDGFQTFAAAGVADAATVAYIIEDGDAWEVGTGVYTTSGTTLTRVVEESSNADAALDLTGSAEVFIGLTAAALAAGATIRASQVFTASGTWTKPAGLDGNTQVRVQLFGGGGGGGSGSGGGGGGGAGVTLIFLASELGATETVTIGAGGAVNTVGSNSTFGSLLTAFGGGRGFGSQVGEGATETSRGGTGSSSNRTGPTANTIYGGGGGGQNGLGGDAVFGGGGGGSANNGGASAYGGNGGNSGQPGLAPAGGGGRNAAGARGECRVYI